MNPPPDDDPSAERGDDGSSGDGSDRGADDPPFSPDSTVDREDRPPERPRDEPPDTDRSVRAPPNERRSNGERSVDPSSTPTDPGRSSDPDSTGNDPLAPSPVEPTDGSRDSNPGAAADDAARPDAPAPRRARDDADEEEDEWLVTFFVDVASSALAVLLVGFFLFTVSGVWPPMVAVESASMTPNMQTGDLVFVMEEDRFPGDGAQAQTGVVTARAGAESGYSTFGKPGDVVVYQPNGNEEQTPIIHRAMFWVEKGEKWYDEADKQAVGSASSCEELANCPAPHAGFITKGDANPTYDQVGHSPHSSPVKPEWIVGTAEVRVPKLGCIRLPSERCGGVLDGSQPIGPILAPTVADADVLKVTALPADG